MKSPFPGMDPYIEACGLWGDFHHALIEAIKNALALVVPERYLVRTNERPYVVLIGTNGKESHPFYPDVGITGEAPAPAAVPGGGIAIAQPATEAGPVALRPFIEERYRESFVEIYEAEPELQLVTCIEVLSPSNKRRGSEGWDLYLRKRQALLLGQANLVEIDLLRGGQRMPMLDPWPASPYTLLVGRPWRVPRCLVWPASFNRPLPSIPVPLRDADPDIPLSLQALIETIYTLGRYARSIDYAKPLTPPLAPEEAAWFEQQLQVRQTTS
ncbi:MAG TPA: DUF4058 family protein [Gemmataceae bacterium]|nr:DUF4058 family protein [Gemmataceae bacterium]